MASGVRLPDGKIHDHCEFDESANDSMNRQFRGSNTAACFCCSLVLGSGVTISKSVPKIFFSHFYEV